MWARKILIERWQWIVPVMHHDLGLPERDAELPLVMREVITPVHPSFRSTLNNQFRPDFVGRGNALTARALREFVRQRYGQISNQRTIYGWMAFLEDVCGPERS